MSMHPTNDPARGEDPRQRLGIQGERLAEAHLRRLGYRTLARRVRAARGELDLVMRDGETVVFVEVKLRSSPAAEPQFAVNAEKRRRLASAARAFLGARGWVHAACRFDIVAIAPGAAGRPELSHFRDAFAPARW